MARYTKTGTPNTIGALNSQLDLIATAIGDTFSRKGDAPNQMEAILDMNSNRIINLPAPLAPTDAVRLKDISPVYSGTQSNFKDIRDFGATPNSPTLDSTPALNRALAVAEGLETVLIEGGVYYFSNTIFTQKILVSGSGTICPISTYNNTLPLFTIQGDSSQINGLTFDMLNTASYPLRVESKYNIIKDLIVKNIDATPSTSTSAAAVHLTGSGALRNTIEGITVEDCVNISSSNPSIPRCITIDGGADYNSIRDVHGYNVAAGIVHGTGVGNVLDGFVFDNSQPTDEEQRNGIYALEGCSYFTCMNGVIKNSSQPIVDKGLGNLYKDIREVDSDADGVANSTDCTFDGITKVYTDNSSNGGFLRSRGDNVGFTVENLTVRNCRIVIPNHYVTAFTFNTGEVNNLLAENNTFISQNVDDALFRNIVIHSVGENPRYIGNTFIVENNETPYATLQAWTIRLPSNATTGKWFRNSLESRAANCVVRLLGGLDNAGIEIDDTNQLRADFGSAYIQSGYTGRFLRGIIPPNSGVWNSGDTINNINVDTTPPSASFEYQKYAFFVCSKSGDFSDAANIPEFSLVHDVSASPVLSQVIPTYFLTPTADEEITGTSASLTVYGFRGTSGEVHQSTDWQVATDSDFTTVVFSSIADTSNLTSITATGLPTLDTLYTRARMTSTSGLVTEYSLVRKFFTV